MHATAVTASQSMSAGQLNVRKMTSSYNCCAHSFPGPLVTFILVYPKRTTRVKRLLLHDTYTQIHANLTTNRMSCLRAPSSPTGPSHMTKYEEIVNPGKWYIPDCVTPWVVIT